VCVCLCTPFLSTAVRCRSASVGPFHHIGHLPFPLPQLTGPEIVVRPRFFSLSRMRRSMRMITMDRCFRTFKHSEQRYTHTHARARAYVCAFVGVISTILYAARSTPPWS
jgi:hypothetical protein